MSREYFRGITDNIGKILVATAIIDETSYAIYEPEKDITATVIADTLFVRKVDEQPLYYVIKANDTKDNKYILTIKPHWGV